MANAHLPSKADLRARIRRLLKALPAQEQQSASAAACANVLSLDAVKHGSVIMLYMPLANEVDLTPAAVRCFQMGKTVCVPSVDWTRKDMSAVEVSSFDDDIMDIDEHGLRSPRESRPVLSRQIDVIIVPGLAFDPRGNRLGRGGGYYDRFLPRLRQNAVSVGLAFDQQIVDAIPVDDRDVSVDLVVTDRRIATIRTAPSRHR